MYDEGLDVARKMWTGRAYQHDGTHYHVHLEQTAPEPHRIPVWVDSSANNPHVIRRAAGCDGIFPNPGDHRLVPDEVAGIVAAVHGTGLTAGRPFDVAVAGNASPAWEEPVNVDLAVLAQAGMTWWMESLIHFDPLDCRSKLSTPAPPAERVPIFVGFEVAVPHLSPAWW
jgi:hypothetical protein